MKVEVNKNLLELVMALRKGRQSKYHRPPMTGRVRLNSDSGLRKLARAARRGKLSGERIFSMHLAQRRADLRGAYARP